ncbi:MAG TPA: hypothetical protein VLJ42_07665 [Solirubrobacteraceae bacterium]|nr:hypothetical protein [Solirubrobacteraceae bacterium]
MSRHHKARRLSVLTACVGATAVLGAFAGVSPALATPTDNCTTIYGAGSSLQKIAQGSQDGSVAGVWLNNWNGTYNAGASGCSSKPQVKYNPIGSGAGLDEFGNNTGTIDKTLDTVANADTTSPCKVSGPAAQQGPGFGCLDAYVGTDDPPTAGQLGEAQQAAGALGPVEMTLPVAQAPVAALLSLPQNCTITSNTAVNIANTYLDALWEATVPAGGGYSADTWGAFFTLIGQSFTNTAGTGDCTTPITLQVRSDGSGTSYAFKSYLGQINRNVWAPYASDYDLWPATTDNGGVDPNKGGGKEALHTASHPGSVGYANAADAAAAGNGGFTPGATASTAGGSTSHQILWAQIQNNGTTPGGANFADPLNGTTVANCNDTQIVPAEKGAAYSATDSWFGVLASDPNVSGDLGGATADYPLCALTYVLVWKHYQGNNLFGHTTPSGEAGLTATTTKDLMSYIIGQGQTDIQGNDYTNVPSPLQGKQRAIVNLIAY